LATEYYIPQTNRYIKKATTGVLNIDVTYSQDYSMRTILRIEENHANKAVTTARDKVSRH
jgi:hypothetical protein